MSELAIQMDGVEKAYRFFSLRDLRLALEPGQILGFVGPNGAGKSTTIRILMALVHQDQGEVRVLGRSMPREQAIAKRDIGYMSEDMRLYPGATIAWHMKFVASLHPHWDHDYARRCCAASTSEPSNRSRRCRTASARKRPCCSCSPAGRACCCSTSRRPGLDPVARHEILRELTDVMSDEPALDPVLVAEHAGRRADLRRDHVPRSRADHRVERQGDVPSSVGGGCSSTCRPASRCRPARGHRNHRERPARDRHDQGLHGRGGRGVHARGRHRARDPAGVARGDLRGQRDVEPQGGAHVSQSIVSQLVVQGSTGRMAARRGLAATSACCRSRSSPWSSVAFFVGGSILVVALIFLNVMLVTLTLVNERKEKIRVFMLSMPVSTTQYNVAKLLSSFIGYLVPAANIDARRRGPACPRLRCRTASSRCSSRRPSTASSISASSSQSHS